LSKNPSMLQSSKKRALIKPNKRKPITKFKQTKKLNLKEKERLFKKIKKRPSLKALNSRKI